MKWILVLVIILSIHCSAKLAGDRGWGDQRWVLVEMKGVPVQQSGGRNDAFIRFNVPDRRFNGNGGCNQLSGSYTLDGKEIHFSEVLSTKMACADIEFETAFLATLNNVDKYEMKGNDLVLKKNKEAVLVLRPRSNNNP